MRISWVSFCFWIFLNSQVLRSLLSYCGTCWDRRVTVMTTVRDFDAHRKNMKSGGGGGEGHMEADNGKLSVKYRA